MFIHSKYEANVTLEAKQKLTLTHDMLSCFLHSEQEALITELTGTKY